MLSAPANFLFDWDCKTHNWYLINQSKRIYIDMQVYISRNLSKGYRCIHPLPVLTAVNEGAGGNKDYIGGVDGIGKEDVGSWAFDMIKISTREPDPSYLCETNYRFWDSVMD